MALLDDLNPEQREAVLATEGPVLVLAGAGTGKTRVITYRVAHLAARGVPGSSILAVTFTNKAADQMKERIGALLGRARGDLGGPWVGTFHAFCARLLRREAPRIGLRRDFAIYDEADQATVVKLALRQLGRGEAEYSPRGLLEAISNAKNAFLTPEQFAGLARTNADRASAAVYEAYQRVLQQASALDFDDLLLRAVELLREHAEARAAWSARLRYVMVDEYQDINRPQHELVRLLAGERKNLCVVGDEDQSIYSWRGAEVGFLLRFCEDYPSARVIRLEQNYRSTQAILDAAGAVVAHNVHRLGKRLEATRAGGTLLRFYAANDAPGEAEYVVGELLRHLRSDPTARVAALYRTNFQSRALEEACQRAQLRYRVLGGFSFYERAEVKDVLAYIRLVLNPENDVALLRVINTPPRGIGKATVESVRDKAMESGRSLWTALGGMVESGAAGRSTAPLRSFRELIDTLRGEYEALRSAEPGEEVDRADEGDSPGGATPWAARLVERILELTGYLDLASEQDKVEHSSRAENLRELLSALAEGAERGETLADFLNHAALVSDADDYDEGFEVTLATLHSSKGLEFDHVLLVGLEEGLFPHMRSRGAPDDLEEERRLCYVGMTRAKQTLTLTRAIFRRIFGNDLQESAEPSRFLREIPPELIETVPGSLAEAGDWRRLEPSPEAAMARRGARATRTAKSLGQAGTETDGLVGARVRHPTYGVGTVLDVEEEGGDRKLTVSFPGYGAKKLLERFARLERV